MAERVLSPPLLNVILLGKTGLGKSTTGNKLINADGNNAAAQALAGDLRREWPLAGGNPVAENDAICFHVSDGSQSATQGCVVIRSNASGFRVMDTRGFAPSEVGTTAYLANLQIVREVVRVSTDLGLNYHRVLYFLPEREIPTGEDRYLQEELAVMWHFFGEAIFKNMIIVATVNARHNRTDPSFDAEFGEGAESKLNNVFKQALKHVVGLRGDNVDVCHVPPIAFVPSGAENHVVADIVRRADVREQDGIYLKFHETTCCKCATIIRQQHLFEATCCCCRRCNAEHFKY